MSKALKKREEFFRKREMQKEGFRDSGIGILTKKMKTMSGADERYVRDFSGGCSGLKRIKVNGKNDKE